MSDERLTDDGYITLRHLKKKPIKGGITCIKCGHERFKFMRVCPRCEEMVYRELDTSTKESVG